MPPHTIPTTCSPTTTTCRRDIAVAPCTGQQVLTCSGSSPTRSLARAAAPQATQPTARDSGRACGTTSAHGCLILHGRAHSARTPFVTDVTYRLAILLLCSWPLALACGGTSSSGAGGGDSGTSGAAGGGGQEGGAGAGGGDIPAPCVGLPTPYADPACAQAMRADCTPLATEDVCTARMWEFSGGYRFYCTWATVVRLSDPATCEVASVSERCELYSREDFVEYLDACEVETPGLYSSWAVIPGQNELLKAEGTLRGYEEETSVCADNISPPAPQPICSCRDAACSAIGLETSASRDR